MLGRSLILLQTGYWPSYCQISTDLNKILHTPIVVRNTFVGRLRPRSARGQLQAKPKRVCFCNTCSAHWVLYMETTDRRNFDDKLSKWRWGRVLSWTISEFFRGQSQIQKQHFSHFRVPFDYPAHSLEKTVYPKPMVPMDSRYSEGVPFASLESLWPGIWQI